MVGNPEKLEQPKYGSMSPMPMIMHLYSPKNQPEGKSTVGFLVLQLVASDKDEGSNAQIRYYFSNIPLSASQKFSLDSTRGMISLVEPLDFEESTDPIVEDSQIGTVIALINVHDRDTGNNGKIICYLEDDLPFKILPSSKNYYKLVTDRPLDREKASQYNITITAIDKGTPPLSTHKTIMLHISDINDNAPAFDKASYRIYMAENNPSDGIVYAQRSFDYEQFREFQLQVKAQDGGVPSQQQHHSQGVYPGSNDNSPQILSPSPDSKDSALFEMVPRSAEADYLVTKVVAVDADSDTTPGSPTS
ncbi:hypothetical protein E2320_010871 [Naja naja]|nr:hypothetical protein E2320_010871 [Naja naja]